jgi:hypothetical protein
MNDHIDNAASGDSLPAISVATLGLMFVAGFFATIAFDLWGQLISPGLGFASLSPHGLAKSLLAKLGLPSGDFAGYFVHFYLVGLIGYPIGWLFIFRPISGERSWAIAPDGSCRPQYTGLACGCSRLAASPLLPACRSFSISPG